MIKMNKAILAALFLAAVVSSRVAAEGAGLSPVAAKPDLAEQLAGVLRSGMQAEALPVYEIYKRTVPAAHYNIEDRETLESQNGSYNLLLKALCLQEKDGTFSVKVTNGENDPVRVNFYKYTEKMAPNSVERYELLQRWLNKGDSVLPFRFNPAAVFIVKSQSRMGWFGEIVRKTYSLFSGKEIEEREFKFRRQKAFTAQDLAAGDLAPFFSRDGSAPSALINLRLLPADFQSQAQEQAASSVRQALVPLDGKFDEALAKAAKIVFSDIEKAERLAQQRVADEKAAAERAARMEAAQKAADRLQELCISGDCLGR